MLVVVRGADNTSPGLRLESDLHVVANRYVADPRIDRIRSRIRDIGVEAAEPAAALEQHKAERRHGRRRVTAPPVLRRRVNGVDRATSAGVSRRSGHRTRMT